MRRALRREVRIEVEHRFGVSVQEGFDYITEPANWPAYWPRFVRLDRGSRWRTPGDGARITLRILAREVDLEMTLARFEPYRVVEYTSEQRGLPAARHRRHFQAADAGFAPRARPHATSKLDSASNATRQTARPAVRARADGDEARRPDQSRDA